MNEIEATKKTLEIYIKTDAPVTQGFYQALSKKALETIKKLENALVIISKSEDGCRRRGIGYDRFVDHVAKTALGQL